MDRLGKLLLAVASAFVTFTPALAGQEGIPAGDEQAIRQVVVNSYIGGVLREHNEEKVRQGFHPDFHMVFEQDGQLRSVSLEMWLEMAEEFADSSRPMIDYEFATIDVAGSVAMARMEIFADGRHLFTDFLCLHRLADGWSIVSKVFTIH